MHCVLGALTIPLTRRVVTFISLVTVISPRLTTTTTTIKTAFRNNLHNLRNMSSTSKHSFKEDFRFSVNDYISVSKYVSAKTGLVVTIADVPGPIVDGYLTLATEAHDDDGLPHTLEHLVFMGSEDFPYKGDDEGVM